MSLRRRTVGGAIAATSFGLLWAFNAFGVVVDVVSLPQDAGTLRGAAIEVLRKFAEAPDWAIYPVLGFMLLIGGALLFNWHPDKGWGWPFRRRALLAQPPISADELDYVPLQEAGRWLYSNASERLRHSLKSMVPDPFSTIAEHAAAYYTTQWQEGRCDLYGRWEPGLPMEKMVFGANKRTILDQAVLRRDLRPVLEYYEQDEGKPKPSNADLPDNSELNAQLREIVLATRWANERQGIIEIWQRCIEAGEEILRIHKTVDDDILAGEYGLWRSGLKPFYRYTEDFFPDISNRVQSGLEGARTDAEATAIVLGNLRRLENLLLRGGPSLEDLSIFDPK